MKLKIRCPACVKLYEVQSEDIHTEAPIFQCVSCETRFSFEYPPADPANVFCFSIAEVSKAAAPADAKHQDAGKSCPKCGALCSAGAKECYSCHVIFERLEGLPQDKSLNAQPSLVRKWKNLLENFEDEKLHDEFIRSCHAFDALRFAVVKYEELKAVQGGDEICDQMLSRLNSLMMVGLSQKPVRKEAPPVNLSKPKWMKYLYWGPFGVSALLILMGMINLGHRNLIGVGVALTCMALGLIVIIRGKISASDFLD